MAKWHTQKIIHIKGHTQCSNFERLIELFGYSLKNEPLSFTKNGIELYCVYTCTGYERETCRDAGGAPEFENRAKSSSRTGPSMFSRPADTHIVNQGGRRGMASKANFSLRLNTQPLNREPVFLHYLLLDSCLPCPPDKTTRVQQHKIVAGLEQPKRMHSQPRADPMQGGRRVTALSHEHVQPTELVFDPTL